MLIVLLDVTATQAASRTRPHESPQLRSTNNFWIHTPPWTPDFGLSAMVFHFAVQYLVTIRLSNCPFYCLREVVG